MRIVRFSRRFGSALLSVLVRGCVIWSGLVSRVRIRGRHGSVRGRIRAWVFGLLLNILMTSLMRFVTICVLLVLSGLVLVIGRNCWGRLVRRFRLSGGRLCVLGITGCG